MPKISSECKPLLGEIVNAITDKGCSNDKLRNQLDALCYLSLAYYYKPEQRRIECNSLKIGVDEIKKYDNMRNIDSNRSPLSHEMRCILNKPSDTANGKANISDYAALYESETIYHLQAYFNDTARYVIDSQPKLKEKIIESIVKLFDESSEQLRLEFDGEGYEILAFAWYQAIKTYPHVKGENGKLKRIPVVEQYIMSSQIDTGIKKYYYEVMRKTSARLQSFEVNPKKTGYANTFQHEKTGKTFSSLYDLFKKYPDESLIVLESKGGYGKTYALLRLYWDLLFKAMKNVIYISARKLDARAGDVNPIARYVASEIIEGGLDGDSISLTEIGSSIQQLVIIIDSLNESDAGILKIIGEITNCLENRKVTISFVVGSRPLEHEILGAMKDRACYVNVGKISSEFVKSYLNGAYDKLSADMRTILEIPLMLSLYDKTATLLTRKTEASANSNGKTATLKIKKFYEEPVESLIIWNFYHAFVHQRLKDNDNGENALLYLLAYEYVLPDVAYSLNRNNTRFIDKKRIDGMIDVAIERLQEQLRIYLIRFQRLPIRLADLNGRALLLGENETLAYSKKVISAIYASRIHSIAKEALSSETHPAYNAADDRDEDMPGFPHECLCSCLAAQHVINSLRLPDYQVPGTDLYVSKLWVKQDFSGDDKKHQNNMKSMLHHFAELDRRKNGAERLRKLSSMVFDIGVLGDKEIKNDRFNDNRVIPKVVFNPDMVTEKKYFNYFVQNVCLAINAFINCFNTQDDYLRFKTGDR